MPNINKDNLEKALSKRSDKPSPRDDSGEPSGEPSAEHPKMSREQEIAFHQGALTTLINERNELFKMIQNVEAVMQAHIKRLEELGVKIQPNK